MAADAAKLPARFNMARYCIHGAAGRMPEKPALIVADSADGHAAETWSYAGVETAVLSIATGLQRRGLQRGDRLVIRLENTSAYALLFFAAIAAGLVPVPTSAQLTAEEALFIVADSGAAALAVADALDLAGVPDSVLHIGAADVAAMIAARAPGDYADTDAEEPAFLVYTSGTTARPKGVLHAQRSAWGRRPMYRGWYGIGSQDRVLHAGAFNWTYTLGAGLTDPWANGATAIVYTGKERHAWVRLIAATQATIFAAVPTLYRGILRHEALRPEMLASLRHGLTAGEALPVALAADWEAQTGKPLYEALGMSELSTYISSSPGVPAKPGMVGKPQAGRRVAIIPVDGGTEPLPAGAEGLIAADRADPGLMLGYWNRPEEEAEMFRGEWFVSGDLGAMDQDGYIAHRGRANDLIKALGYRVSPMEIEAVLARHPDVAEAACAEVRIGDVSLVGAWIVAHAGAATDEAAGEALRAHAREHLAAYKVPRIVTFVASLPRTANGKVKRAALATAS